MTQKEKVKITIQRSLIYFYFSKYKTEELIKFQELLQKKKV